MPFTNPCQPSEDKMISPNEAEYLIREQKLRLSCERISLGQSCNRILAEDIKADTDLPPFNRVMMDGVALRHSDLLRNMDTFQIAAMQRAGDPPIQNFPAGTCIEIMTGAVCPADADVIIPYEKCGIDNGVCKIHPQDIKPFQNIHQQGIDFHKGDILINNGTLIAPAEIGICASVGKNEIEVIALPSVAIYSTGEELIDITDQPLPHQIRRSNVFVLQQLLSGEGFSSSTFHLADDEEMITKELKKSLDNFDVILLSGGVSKGKFDLIPSVLEKLGVKKIFHRIAQRPGQPMWFGKNDRTVVFAFPGNPVSTLMCAVRYLLPWINDQCGRKKFNPPTITLKKDVTNKAPLTFYHPVIIDGYNDGKLQAIPIHFSGSGDFASLSGCDGFAELPAGPITVEAGTELPVYLFR